MQTSTIILMLVGIVAVLTAVVVVLLWLMHHKDEDIKQKNDVIIHEVRRNQTLIDKAVQNGVNRAALLSWMLAAILTLSGTMMTLTSCSNEDDSTPTPEEEVKAQTYEKIKGIRSDECLTKLGIVRMYEFNEDGTFAFVSIHHSDNNDDGVMDEYESVSIFNKGTWKALGNTTCTLVNESYDAVAVEYQTTHIVQTPELEYLSEGDPTVYRDTLYLIPNPEEGYNFAFQTDIWILKQLSEAQTKGAITRWSLSGLWTVIKQKVGGAISDAWKWVKTALADSYDPIVTGQSDWMGTIFKDVNPKLHEISIPGTHDSFTYGMCKTVGLWGKTQVYDLNELFDAGVRYFDFRLGVHLAEPREKSELGFFHGPVGCCVHFKEVMDNLRELLKKHPGETVIAMVKFEKWNSDLTHQQHIDFLRKSLEPYKDILADPSKYGPEMRLNDCRGKIVIMQRFGEKEYNNSSFGIFCGGDSKNELKETSYGDKKWLVMEQDLCECNIDSDDKTIVNGQSVLYPLHFMYRFNLLEDNFKDAANPPADRKVTWHINKTSGYIKRLGGVYMSYSYNANLMNERAYKYIQSHLGQKTGWVVMDFAGLDKAGAIDSDIVYGDVLMKVLLQNNAEMVKKGVLK